MGLWLPVVLIWGQGVAPLAPEISRVPRGEERRPDAVLRWNDEALDVIRREKTPPPLAARALALMHTAIFDSVNTIHQTHEPYRVRLRAVAEIDPIAATCMAAETVLAGLYPSRAGHFRSVSKEILDAISAGPARERGRTLGVYVARRLLEERRDDDGKGEYRAPRAVGLWRPTPPDRLNALLPDWGETRPFGVRDKKAFRPADPPELTSHEYAKDFNEVKGLGGVDSSSRTADQTLIALFWNDGAGTCTPPGHWNLIAQEASYQQKLTLVENARLFALLNLALADASICCWECKFRFRLWRPVTAIHEADRDANDDTVPNTKWQSLLVTPPFPSYTSGHSTFSGAGAGILMGYFKRDDLAFSMGSDGLAGRRKYRGFQEAADEAGRSRIYGGIHYECDNREGLKVGRAIAEEILKTRLVPEAGRAVSSVVPSRGRP